jgi:hypothetical protein
VSYGKATPYFPVVDLLKRYCHLEERDDPRTIRAKVTGQILTLDEALHEMIPALLTLLDALPADSPLQAHCHLGLGTLYSTTGQREQAHVALSAAIGLYRAMDMTFWLPQAEAALAQVEAS